MLSTADAEGNQDASPKGDGPGFVIVEDDKTLAIPDRKGNKLVFTLQNILANPHVGMIFMVPGTDETLRVNGTAELTIDPVVLERLTARGSTRASRNSGHRARMLFPLRQGLHSRAVVASGELVRTHQNLVG